MSNRAIFLDRDGTINFDSPDYIKNISEFNLIPNASEALAIFSNLNFLNVIISNQSGVSRQFITPNDLDSIHQFLKDKVAEAGGILDNIYYCPHHPDEACNCRKPKTGLLQRAIRDYNIDPEISYFIGDSKKDILVGKAVGCTTILVQTGYKTYTQSEIDKWVAQPDFISENLFQAAKLISQNEEKE